MLDADMIALLFTVSFAATWANLVDGIHNRQPARIVCYGLICIAQVVTMLKIKKGQKVRASGASLRIQQNRQDFVDVLSTPEAADRISNFLRKEQDRVRAFVKDTSHGTCRHKGKAADFLAIATGPQRIYNQQVFDDLLNDFDPFTVKTDIENAIRDFDCRIEQLHLAKSAVYKKMGEQLKKNANVATTGSDFFGGACVFVRNDAIGSLKIAPTPENVLPMSAVEPLYCAGSFDGHDRTASCGCSWLSRLYGNKCPNHGTAATTVGIPQDSAWQRGESTTLGDAAEAGVVAYQPTGFAISGSRKYSEMSFGDGQYRVAAEENHDIPSL